jgi:hypothetical protein
MSDTYNTGVEIHCEAVRVVTEEIVEISKFFVIPSMEERNWFFVTSWGLPAQLADPMVGLGFQDIYRGIGLFIRESEFDIDLCVVG